VNEGGAPAVSRGLTWLRALTREDGRLASGPASVRAVEAKLGAERASFLAVVPDPENRFPRARHGEIGLEEAWTLARMVRGIEQEDRGQARRPIIAIVDVAGQAYGRREEMLGIHLACAAAADAYASARMAGHPVIALVVGKAMAGAFLAHGYQANRILALDAPGVQVHAMAPKSAARVTRRTAEQLEELGRANPPMAYDVRSFASLGLLHRLMQGICADAPSPADVAHVNEMLREAVGDVRAATGAGARDLSVRLSSAQAQAMRSASIEVRRRLAEQWEA